MKELFIKTIKSIEEISDIVNQVLERMDEPGLKDKNIEYRILDDTKFESYLHHMGLPEGYIKISNGSTVLEHGKYAVMLRAANFAPLFSTYFHELGHVATEEIVQKLKLPKNKKEIYFEALAYSFELYAKEEFNKLKLPVKFIDVISRRLKKEYLKEMIRFPGRTESHAKALSLIYGLLDSKHRKYGQIYKTLKESIEGKR